MGHDERRRASPGDQKRSTQRKAGIPAGCGYLLAASGRSLMSMTWKSTSRGLVRNGFLDVGCYIVSAAVLSNFILIADVYKSIYFVRWKAEKLELRRLRRQAARLKKAEAAEAKVLPMAMYGVEFANPPESSIKKLATAILSSFSRRQHDRKINRNQAEIANRP